jgi:hypothetical protein
LQRAEVRDEIIDMRRKRHAPRAESTDAAALRDEIIDMRRKRHAVPGRPACTTPPARHARQREAGGPKAARRV